MLSNINSILNVRPKEKRVVALTLLLSFFTGSAISFVYSSSRALFLTCYGTYDLAYVFIGGAFAVLGVGAVYAKFEERVPFNKLLIGTILFLIASFVGFRLWLLFGEAKWPSLMLAIWFEAFSVLISLCFWGLCNHLFDVRQAKRLFGLIGAGEYVAIILAGFATPMLVRFTGTPNLLFVACTGLTFAAGLTIYITRLFSSQLVSAKSTGGKKERTAFKAKNVFKNRYLLVIHLVWSLSFIAFYINDASFNSQVETHFGNTEAMAGFFGQFFAVGSIIILLMIGFFSGRIMIRFGIIQALFLLPVILLATCIVVAFTGILFSGISAALFWTVIICKISDYIFRYSIFKPAFQVLYQPLTARRRHAAQISIESRAFPVAAILSGGLLLLGRQYFAIDAVNLSPFFILIIALWIGITLILRSEYPKTLLEALTKRRFDNEAQSFFKDETHGKLLVQLVESPHPVEVIHGLDLIEKEAPGNLEPFLVKLLGHPEETVRLDVLDRIERLRPAAALKDVRKIIRKDVSVAVKAAALKTYASLSETDDKAIDEIIGFLDHEDSQIQLDALVGLMRYGGIEGVIVGGVKLLQMKSSPDSLKREFTARAIGEIGTSRFYRPLLPLLRDESVVVQRTALIAAAKIVNPYLIPAVIECLPQPKVRGQAIKTLAAFGEAALPEIKRALTSENQPREVLVCISKVLRYIAGEESTALLLKQCRYPDLMVRHTALMALKARGYQDNNRNRKKFIRRIYKESESASWILNALNTFAKDKNMFLIEKALNDELNRAIQRILALLSIIYPQEYISEAERNLKHSLPEKRAYALEVIENLIDSNLKKIVFPLLDEFSLKKRLELLQQQFRQEYLEIDRQLEAILELEPTRITIWTQVVALYYIGLRRCGSAASLSARKPATENPLFQETLDWAVARLEP